MEESRKEARQHLVSGIGAVIVGGLVWLNGGSFFTPAFIVYMTLMIFMRIND